MVFEGKNIIYIMFNCSWEKGEKGKEEGKGKRKEKYIFLCCVRKNINFHIEYGLCLMYYCIEQVGILPCPVQLMHWT